MYNACVVTRKQQPGAYLGRCWLYFYGVTPTRQKKLEVLVRAGGGFVVRQVFPKHCSPTHVVCGARPKDR